MPRAKSVKGWSTYFTPLKATVTTNLAELDTFYHFLAGKTFVLDVAKEWGRGSMLAAIRRQIQQIVEDEIYRVGWETGNIKESFQVDFLPERMEMVAYSDPNIATSVGPFKDGNPSDFSYAAFFEEPEKFSSFIPSPENDPYNEIRYRPFFTPMVRVIKIFGNRSAAEALITVIKRKAPKRQQESTP